MNKLHALPRSYGYILMLLGVTFFLPALGIFQLYLIPELWTQISITFGWSHFMFGWSVISMVISAIMIAYGCDMVWYHDNKSDPTSIDENAKHSDYTPEPDKESKNVK